MRAGNGGGTGGQDSGALKPTALDNSENNTNLPVKYLGVAAAVLFLPGYPEVVEAVYKWEQAVVPHWR